uniref:LDL receptor related protein 3 n=1 Tax=Nothoprocta perdicaria TaxID=30464 RepID=A0A8C7EFT2_NOTPE
LTLLGPLLTILCSSFTGKIGQAVCQSDEFRCANGKCIPGTWKCNSMDECGDNSDERNCTVPPTEPQSRNSGLCYSILDRCNNQKNCPDGSDEKNCFTCQPGNFHCGTNLCIFETWRCDGQEDCQDGSDEHNCLVIVPRKVITAALIGSLFVLCVLQASVLQNIRTAVRRQMRRHSSRRSSSRRRLGRLWSRLFHRPRARGQIPLLTPARTSQTTLGDGIINPAEGIIRRADGAVRSPPPSPERPNSEPGAPGQARGLREAECSSLQTETETAEPSPSDVLSSTCTAASAEPETGHTDKSLGAESSSSELKQSSKVDSGKAFRDPLSESVAETTRGGSASRRTVPEGRSSSRSHLLSEEPCRLPLKAWGSAYSDSPVNVHIQVDGQNRCCPNSYQEEPLGIRAACCHSVEVPMLESPTPLSEINTSDDESLLVC